MKIIINTLLNYIKTKRFILILIYVLFVFYGDYGIKDKSRLLEKTIDDAIIKHKNLASVDSDHASCELSLYLRDKLKEANITLVSIQLTKRNSTYKEENFIEGGVINSSWHLLKKINKLNYKQIKYSNHSKKYTAIKFLYSSPEYQLIISGIVF
jgi:hypothetical protein